MPVEYNLTTGECFGFLDFQTREEFVAAWAQWDSEVTRRWVAAYPGSRPLTMYILQRIQPWAWKNPTACLRRPLRRIEGLDLEFDTSGHKQPVEFHHLERLGLLEPGERERAKRRFAGDCPTDYTRYRDVVSQRPKVGGSVEPIEELVDD